MQKRLEKKNRWQLLHYLTIILLIISLSIIGYTLNIRFFSSSSTTSSTTINTSNNNTSASPIPISSVKTSDIFVGGAPRQIIVNSNTGRVYVEDWFSANVSVVDAKSHSLITTITLSGDLGEIAIDYSTNKLYVPVGDCINVNLPNITNSCYANQPPPVGKGGILEIDGSTNKIIRKLPYQLSIRAADLAVNSATHILYGVNNSAHLLAIDAMTGSLVASISLSFDIFGIAIDQSTNMVYAVGCNGSFVCDSMMSIINGTTQSIQKTVNFNSEAFTRVTINPATHVVYLTKGNHLVAYNGTSEAVIYDAWTRTCSLFDHLEVVQPTNQVLAIALGLKYVLAYDGSTGELVNMYDTSPSEHQYVAYNPATDELYATFSRHLLTFRNIASTGHVNSTLLGPGINCPLP